MSFSRKTIIYAAAPLTLAAVLATTAGATAASASVHQPPRVASGSVAVSGQGYPVQYEQFQVLQGFGRNHGSVVYTNFGYAEPGSGVYAPAAKADTLVFTLGGTYTHTLNGASLHEVALSNNRLAFSGTGVYSDGTTTWTIKGQVNGNRLTARIAYDHSTYKLAMTGRIASDGSALGTASGPGQALTWTMPAGSFTSVLSYRAPVQSDQIQGRNATFTFTIPNSAASSGLAGVKVTDKVHDGGFGPRHDRFAQDNTLEQIVGGPGITVR